MCQSEWKIDHQQENQTYLIKKEETYDCNNWPTWISEVGIAVKKKKELMEGHHQEWSLWLNLTQHGKTHQVQT